MLVLLEAQPGGSGVRLPGLSLVLCGYACVVVTDDLGGNDGSRVEPVIHGMAQGWLGAQPKGDLEVGRTQIMIGQKLT